MIISVNIIVISNNTIDNNANNNNNNSNNIIVIHGMIQSTITYYTVNTVRRLVRQ